MVGAPQGSEEDQLKKNCVETVQEIFQEKVPLIGTMMIRLKSSMS